MAENIKISLLNELTSAQNSTIVPVVDGGTTQKMSLSTLQTHLTASFVTPTQLSTQISNVNSTIGGLTTADVTENASYLYYTDARVDARIIDIVEITSSAMVDATEIQNLSPAVIAVMDVEGVLSGSIDVSSITDFDTEVSRSAAEAGFGAGGGGDSTAWNDIISKPSGLVSSSAQITSLGFISESISASYALTASYALNAGDGGGGSTDYISNITFSGTTLTFTGVGSAFNTTVDLSTGDLLDLTDTVAFLNASQYYTDSSSFASRVSQGSVPFGTVSSSAQTLRNLGDSGIISASTQIAELGANIVSSSIQVLGGITSDDIFPGSFNLYYTNASVLSYINSLDVLSGSISNFITDGTVSSSAQITNLGFLTTIAYASDSASVANRLDSVTGLSPNDVNIFTAEQIFRDGVTVTGSISLTTGDIKLVDGVFSGSGQNLYNIPASSIVGLVPAGSLLSDGNNDLAVNFAQGVTATIETGSFNVLGANLIVSGGFFSGSGAGLTGIPGSAIEGGVDGQKIYSSSFSASITDAGEFLVNTNAIFESDIYSSGSITATAINVGTSGTPTIFSANNLNLSASNAVVITDSPLRLTPFTNAQTSSFTYSNGDLVYSLTSHDFYGYKSGSLVSLTAGGSGTSVNWAQIIGIPSGLISSSAGFVSSSVQIAPAGGTGDILFKNSLGVVTSSADFRYTEGTETLTAPTMSVGVLSYNSLSGPSAATGSFNLVDADRVLINNDYELPTSDGTADQVIKTNGSGITTFGFVGWTEIESLPSALISSSNQLVELDVALEAQANTFTADQFISGSLYVTQSAIVDTLVLTPRHPKPTLPETGSIIVSASAAGPLRPFFYDGTAWFPMFA